MSIVNTAELKDTALDWAVARCEGRTVKRNPMGLESTPAFYIWEETPSGKGGILIDKSIYMRIGSKYSPSTNREQGFQIAEENLIGVNADPENGWRANSFGNGEFYTGRIPLIAAMRCYVASVLGETVEVPDVLI